MEPEGEKQESTQLFLSELSCKPPRVSSTSTSSVIWPLLFAREAGNIVTAHEEGSLSKSVEHGY